LAENFDISFELKFEMREYQEINDEQWVLVFPLSLRMTMKGVVWWYANVWPWLITLHWKFLTNKKSWLIKLKFHMPLFDYDGVSYPVLGNKIKLMKHMAWLYVISSTARQRELINSWWWS